MVCDVLVCEVYKAAGVFGNLTDTFQCTEFTNWYAVPPVIVSFGRSRVCHSKFFCSIRRDVYSLNIFNATRVRPEACQVADPELPYCQVGASH